MTKAQPASLTGSVLMLGASGAVGSGVLNTLTAHPQAHQLTLLVRRNLPGLQSAKTRQHIVDVFNPASYQHLLAGHQAAICTFGVGESSKVSNEEFIRIDKTAVLAFATACKTAGVKHFELLSAVAANAQ